MAFCAAVGAGLGGDFVFLVVAVYDVGGDDTGGDGDDGVANEHDDGGEELAEAGERGDVAIADGGEGNDGPVDTVGDGVEARIDGAFDQVHEGADDGYEDEHEGEEDENFRHAAAQGGSEQAGLFEEAYHFEDAEYSQQTQGAYDEQGTAACKKEAEISWQDTQQVNDAVKAKDVVPGPIYTVNSQNVFDGEKDGKAPFQGVKELAIALSVLGR